MQYFPFFLNIHTKLVLLVGGGVVAQRKADLLQKAGCHLRLVAPTVRSDLEALLQHNGTVSKRPYQPDDITGCTLVVCATNDEAINARVSADCRQRGVPVNVVDCPALSDFIFPALIDRSPLTVAVSSAGASPVLARRVREKIESSLPMATGALAVFCEEHRQTVKDALPPQKRRLFWEDVLDSEIAENILAGNSADAKTMLLQRLQQFGTDSDKIGQVYLIGAGPGAADLLTFRALRLLQQADVVVHDRLVSTEVLALARRDAEKIFVGKCRNQQLMSQEEINQLLINLARKNLRVARLKGGDPFIFGRGGEELQALRAANIPTQIVPGITAASGCAASVEMPLTYRHLARSVRFVTVYEQDKQDAHFWQKLANEQDTTQVFYMAGATMAFVCERLIAAGSKPQTPAVLICGGTTTAQQHFSATLETLPAMASSKWFSPALLVVGEVAALARKSYDAIATASTSNASIEHLFMNLQHGESHAINQPMGIY